MAHNVLNLHAPPNFCHAPHWEPLLHCLVFIMGRYYTFLKFTSDTDLVFSDIDIVLFGEWKYLPLFTLHEELVKHGLADKSTSRVIEHSIVSLHRLILYQFASQSSM